MINRNTKVIIYIYNIYIHKYINIYIYIYIFNYNYICIKVIKIREYILAAKAVGIVSLIAIIEVKFHQKSKLKKYWFEII